MANSINVASENDFSFGDDGFLHAVREGNLVEQKDEVTALQSIYEGDSEERIRVFSEPDCSGSGQYVIQVTVPVEINVEECQVDIWLPTWDNPSSEKDGASLGDAPPKVGQGINLERTLSGQKWTGSFKVRFLHPLTFDLTFPLDYPSHSAPSFTLSCIWLSGKQLSLLCKQLDKLWEDNQNMPIVFTWMNWLEKEALCFLGIEHTIVLTPTGAFEDSIEEDRAVPDCNDLGHAVHSMLRYSTRKAAIRFCQLTQECGLCFEEKLGSKFFHLMPCSHHFCSDCMTAYCTMHVKDGTVQLLKCPAPKCETIVSPDILQAVLSPDLYVRWETLSLQRTLDEMKDISYCPRCSRVVICEAESNLHLGFCLSCFYSFCTQCGRLWHQGNPCQSEEDILQEQEKRIQPGKEEALKKFVEVKRRMMEEERSRSEISRRTVCCPKCKARVEKNGGCNHMTCRCGEHFCWHCGKSIDGYSHFDGNNCQSTDAAHRVQPPVIPEALLIMRARMELMPDAKDHLMHCVNCKQENLKVDKNNHLRCWNCKTNMCFFCRSRITGIITKHFALYGCPQHS